MDSKKDKGTNFECTICLETAKEPVLTKCGHMFCWPCIYNWLDSKGGRAKCPNCKNQITKNDLIPVYANDENKENTNRFKNIPKRPKAERNPNSDNDDNGSQNFFNFSFGSFGLGGFFPFMMNFGNNNRYETEYNNNYSNNNTNTNQRQSEFLQGVPENTKQAIINLMLLMFFVLFFMQFY